MSLTNNQLNCTVSNENTYKDKNINNTQMLTQNVSLGNSGLSSYKNTLTHTDKGFNKLVNLSGLKSNKNKMELSENTP